MVDDIRADAKAEEAEVRREAERELAFSLPGLFSKADPERMLTAIAAARSAGVDAATVADAERKMARALEREEEERKRQATEKDKEDAEVAITQAAADEKAAALARAMAREQTPEAQKLRRATAPALPEIDVDALLGAITEARRAGVSAETVNEGVTKVAQARRWSAATQALAAATAEPTAEVSTEVIMYRLRTSVVEARAVGLPSRAVEVAAAQLASMEEVVERRREAERELAFSLPGLFSKANPERMRSAIAVARREGVAEHIVVDAEDKMARVLEREEEARLRKEQERLRKLADEAAKLEAADAKAAHFIRAGHAANDRGAPDFARAKFVAAYRISSRPSTLVSAANMALKMGDAATAVREYEKVLHASGELTPALAAAAEQKMSEARAALEHSALAREYAAGPQSSPQKALHFSEHSSPQQLGRPYMGSGRIEESSPGGREDPNALGPVSDRGQLWWHLRARLAAALLKAARVLLVCGVLALAAAALHVAWVSRGDACRGLAAARGTLSLANATLANAHEAAAAPLRPVSSLFARRISADVLEPTARLVSLVTSSRLANRLAHRAAASRVIVWLSDAAAGAWLLASPYLAAVLTATLDSGTQLTHALRARATGPATRMLAEMDEVCHPPPPCHFAPFGVCLW